MAGALVTTNILQTLVAMGLASLRENCVMPRIVNREYEDEIVGSRRGSTVQVAVPSAITARAVTPDVVYPATPAITPTSVSITLSEWYEAPFIIDDKGFAQCLAGVRPLQLQEAAKSMANQIDTFLWSKYKDIYGYVGTAGTTPFASDLSAYLDARAIANKQLMPMDDRFCIIDEDAEANALGLRAFQDASFRGDTAGIIRGQIGEKLGAQWAMSQNVPTHTVTGAGTVLVNDASVSVGDSTLTWDGGGTEPVSGDAFVVAGDTQTYTVKSATATVITMEPTAQVAWADNAAVTFKGTGPQNLLVHRDCIAFAMAPLASQGLADSGANVAVAIDEVSGLSLRLEVSRQYKQTIFSFDSLYGASVIRPELAVRIAG